MELFRLEHKDTREGPWTKRHNGEPVVNHLLDKTLANMPMPDNDIYRYNGCEWKAGVITKSNFNKWFPEAIIEELKQYGFRVVRIITNDIIPKDDYVLYNASERYITIPEN